MKHFVSDGKRLLNVEYDEIPELSDIVDGMMVISKDVRSIEETAIFLLEQTGNVTCYVLDEIYIVGHVSGFENITLALEAWHNHEI